MYLDGIKRENYNREKWNIESRNTKFPYPAHFTQYYNQNLGRNQAELRRKESVSGRKNSQNGNEECNYMQSNNTITSNRISSTKCKPVEIIPDGDTNIQRFTNQGSYLGYQSNEVCKDKLTTNGQPPDVQPMSRIPRPVSMPPSIKRTRGTVCPSSNYSRDMKSTRNDKQGDLIQSIYNNVSSDLKCKTSSNFVHLPSKLPSPKHSPIIQENRPDLNKPVAKDIDSLGEDLSRSAWHTNSSEGTSFQSSNHAFIPKLLEEKSPDTTLVEAPGNLKTLSKDNSETQPDRSITFTDSRIKSEPSSNGGQTEVIKCPACAFIVTEPKVRQQKGDAIMTKNGRNRKSTSRRGIRGVIMQQLFRCVRDPKVDFSVDSVNNESRLSTFLNIHDADMDDDDRTINKSSTLVSVFLPPHGKKSTQTKCLTNSIYTKLGEGKKGSTLSLVPRPHVKRINVAKRLQKKQRNIFRRLDQRLVQLGQLQSNGVTTVENNFLTLNKCLNDLTKQIENLAQCLNDQSITLSNLSKAFECRERMRLATNSPLLDRNQKKTSPLGKVEVSCSNSRIQTPEANAELMPKGRGSLQSRSVSVTSQVTKDSGLSRRSSVLLNNKQTASSEDYTLVTEPCSKLSDKSDKLSYGQIKRPSSNTCHNLSPGVVGKMIASTIPNENGDTESMALVDEIPIAGKTPEKEASTKSTLSSSLPLNVNERKNMTQEMKHQTLQKYYRIAYVGQDPYASVEALNKSQISIDLLKSTSRMDSIEDKSNGRVGSANKSSELGLTRVLKEARLVACEFVPCKVKPQPEKKQQASRSISQPKVNIQNQMRSSSAQHTRVLSTNIRSQRKEASSRVANNVGSSKLDQSGQCWMVENSRIGSPKNLDSVVKIADQNSKSLKSHGNALNKLTNNGSDRVSCAGDMNCEPLTRSNSSYTVVCHSKTVTTAPSKTKSNITKVLNDHVESLSKERSHRVRQTSSNKNGVRCVSKTTHLNTETPARQRGSHSSNTGNPRNRNPNYQSRTSSANNRHHACKSKQPDLPMDGVWKAHLHLAVNKFCPADQKPDSGPFPYTNNPVYIAGCNNSSLDWTTGLENQPEVAQSHIDLKSTDLDCLPFSELSNKPDPVLNFSTINKRKFQQLKEAFYHKSNLFTLPEDSGQPELSYSQTLIARGRALRRAAQEKQILDEMEKLNKQRLNVKSPNSEIVRLVQDATALPNEASDEVQLNTTQKNVCNGQSQSKHKGQEREFICEYADPCVGYTEQRKYVIDGTDYDVQKMFAMTRRMIDQPRCLRRSRCSTSSPIVFTSGTPILCCSDNPKSSRKKSKCDPPGKKCFTFKLSGVDCTPAICQNPCLSPCYPPCSPTFCPPRTFSCEYPVRPQWSCSSVPSAAPIINNICSCPMCCSTSNMCAPYPCNVPCCTRMTRCYSRCRSCTSTESCGTVSRICDSDGYCDLVYMSSSSASGSQTPVKLTFKKDNRGRRNRRCKKNEYRCVCSHNSCNSLWATDRGYHSNTSLSDDDSSQTSNLTVSTDGSDSQYESFESDRSRYRSAKPSFQM